MKQKFVAIRNQGEGQQLSLYFLDIIQDEYDYWSGMTYSKIQEIIDHVNNYRPSSIKCVIDSEGGDAATGIAVYNFLKACGLEIEVEIIGLAGSIASVIAQAASPGKLLIARNAFMMIHKAWGVTGGNGDEIRKYADLVDKFTGQVVDIYSQRTGKSIEDINALIENGDYWMTGTEAVEQGFADATFNEVTGFKVAARLQQGLDPNYTNVPAFIYNQTANNFQKQFDDMKKFVLDLFNAMKGVKPLEGATQEVINAQVATATEAPLTALADEIDNTINNRVTEAMKPLALGEGETLAGTIQNLQSKITELEKKNTELETAIANKVGNKTVDHTQGTKTIGSFE